MRLEDRERGPDAATLSAGTAPTPEDVRIADALATGLGRLRVARPAFADGLEHRLLDRLAEPARPWWKRRRQARPRIQRVVPGAVRMPRRSFIGLAAASALVLAGASVSLPLVGTPEVSAREILEKVQANSENPGLAGVKSFHLTAKIWNDHRRVLGDKEAPEPREMTTEQWFVAPDKMRTESRTQDSSGKAVISGMMSKGSEFKPYSTTGAADAFMISMFAAPIGAKSGDALTAPATGVAKPGATWVAGTRVDGPGQPGASEKPFTVAFATKKPGNPGETGQDDRDVFVVSGACAEPKRSGEGTIAGRPVFVVENDFSSCLPADAPAELKGRHVRWVDQKTFLPLKMEMYGQDGALVDRYEVTSIEYDVDIPDKIFTELPAGTTVRDLKLPQLPPPEDGSGPQVRPIAP